MLGFSLMMVLSAHAMPMHGQQIESMVSPGRCHSAANRYNYSAPNFRKSFEDDAQAARDGRPTRYTDERRAELLAALDKDDAAAAAVMARYGKAKIKASDERLIRSLNLAELLSLLRGCAAAA